MNMSAWTAKHRRTILSLLLLAAVAGLLSALRMPVGLFPTIQFPRVVVSIEAGDQPAEQMVVNVTRPLEQAVRSVPGVINLRSNTSRGSAEMSINMNWGEDTRRAALEIQSAIGQTLPSLPPGVSFSVRRMDPTVFPVAAYSLTSESVDPITIRNFAHEQLSPLLASIDGVATVAAVGGEVGEFQVEIEEQHLIAYNLTISDVASALAGSNVLMAVGRTQDLHKLFLNLVDDRITSIEDIKNSIIKAGPNGNILLDDIADIRLTAAPQWLIVSADGRPAVSLRVYQQPNANTVKITKEVKKRLADFEPHFPKGVILKNWYDQSDLILSAAGSVRDAILIGVVLAAGVLFVFLRNFKITVIALITVPATLAVTSLILFVLGRSFNIMTLGGMAAAIGLIIDDAIVMVEQIIRSLTNKSLGDHKTRVRAAAVEFFKPFAGSSTATIVIFLPLAFLGGVTGAFFKALSLTMASALLISFIFGWIAIPLVADKILSEKDAENEERKVEDGPITKRYLQGLRFALDRPLFPMIAVLAFLALGLLMSRFVGSGFMPPMDEGGFVLDYKAPPGTSLVDTNQLVKQVEQVLQETPEVESYSRRTGIQLGGGLTEANEGDFFVKLKPPPRRTIDEVTAEVRVKVEQRVPGLAIDTAQLMEDLIGDLTAVPQPIEVKIFGDDANTLLETAPKVADAISTIRGVVSVEDGIVPAGDTLAIKIDRQRTTLEGLTPSAASDQISAKLDGVIASQVQQGERILDIRVWLDADERSSILDVSSLRLKAPDGHTIPLSRIASIERISGEPQITRENLKRMVAVTGRIEGRDMGSTVAEVKKTLDGKGTVLPSSVYYELGGLYKEQQSAFLGLIIVFAASTMLVFVVVLFLFERFSVAAPLLLVPAVGAASVFLGLSITGTQLNISALMGLTMILGIMTEVSIFYFSEYENQRTHGQDMREALIEAGRLRLRPIAMTTIAAILALMPLAFALGEGAKMQQPLAIAIISGLLVQMPVVLIVMPALFLKIEKIASKAAG